MNELRRHVLAGHPVLRVSSWEEEAAAQEVLDAARATLGADLAVHEWDAASGLTPPHPGVTSLEQALDAAGADRGPAVWIFRDIHLFAGAATVLRRIRRLAAAIAARPVRVVLLTPPGEQLADVAHEIPTATHAVPSYEVLTRIVEEEAGLHLDPAIAPRVVASALRGLTGLEARLALRRVLAGGLVDELSLSLLFEEKARRIEGSALEFFPPTVTFDDVGGLAALKEWVAKRTAAFRGTGDGARQPPRGVLLTGVSGCGKSYAVKAMSRAFAAALFRLDMARIFARREPEGAFSRAIGAVEAMAPCILWIDEIENALALGTQDSGPSSRIAGAFLTWLQERPEGIFVAATANRIELLPAELMRRGRFDQIFFVDLPEEEERKRIWSIHLEKRRVNPGHFDLIVLARSTAGWSGAEIEAAAEAALVEASSEEQLLSQALLFRAIGRTVPLSVTMKEQIKKVKEWAHERALSASGKAIA